MWLYLVQFFGIIFLISAIAVGLMMWSRRRIGVHRLKLNHEVAGFVYAVVGTIFAVTVALVVDTVYDEYLLAEKRLSREALQLSSIHMLADWFPSNGGPALKHGLEQYVRTVVETEWPRNASMLSKTAPESDQALLQVSRYVIEIQPVSIQQQAAYSELVQRLASLNEARYSRIFERQPGIPSAMWVIVIAGAIITIGFTMFFAMESTPAQILVVFSVTALICSNLMLIFTVHYPFNGAGITPPYALLELMKRF